MAKEKTMLVKNLVSWAGHGHSYAPGDHIELPVEIAKARIAVGLAAMPDSGAAEGDNIGKLKAEIAALTADKKELADKLATTEADVARLTEELVAANAALESATAPKGGGSEGDSES